MLDNIKGTNKIKVVEAGPEFFDSVNAEWERTWNERTPVLKELRQEAAQI